MHIKIQLQISTGEKNKKALTVKNVQYLLNINAA